MNGGIHIKIIYSNKKQIIASKLSDLFLSVNWVSGNNPTKLAKALKNHSKVYTAWDGCRLVGLISSLDDGIMNAYIQYLLVNPAYQGIGIGNRLLEILTAEYHNYLNVSIISYKETVSFYEKHGFKDDNESQALFYTL